MDFQSIGRLILILGVMLAVVGGAMMLLARFTNAGNLPLDIRVQGQNFSCFAPIGTMILLSIILTVVLNIVIRILNR